MPRADSAFMAEALRLAADLPDRPWPNPPVGAVVVRDGEIVGRGRHLGPGRDHAEVVALGEAGEAARGATLYVTLEPCNHQGRTPACAPQVVAAGISRVVFGVRDPNPAVAGGGERVLREAGLETAAGVLGERCLEMIWPFAASEAFRRPFVLLKTAVSLDGRFAPGPGRDPEGEPFYLTGEKSLAEVHRLRRWCDAVLVGARTVVADDPRLDGRMAPGGCPRRDPLPACADTDLKAAPGWNRPGALVFTGPRPDPAAVAALGRRGMKAIPCAAPEGRVDPAGLLERAAEAGVNVLMIEGGPTLAASFLSAGLVDRWVSFVAPVFLGGGPALPCDRDGGPDGGVFGLTRSLPLGTDMVSIWDRTGFTAALAELAADGRPAAAGSEA